MRLQGDLRDLPFGLLCARMQAGREPGRGLGVLAPVADQLALPFCTL